MRPMCQFISVKAGLKLLATAVPCLPGATIRAADAPPLVASGGV